MHVRSGSYRVMKCAINLTTCLMTNNEFAVFGKNCNYSLTHSCNFLRGCISGTVWLAINDAVVAGCMADQPGIV